MGVETHYDVLNVSRSASYEEIKIAFHRLARSYHPDKQQQQVKSQEEDDQNAILKRPVLIDSGRFNRHGRYYEMNNGGRYTMMIYYNKIYMKKFVRMVQSKLIITMI